MYRLNAWQTNPKGRLRGGYRWPTSFPPSPDEPRPAPTQTKQPRSLGVHVTEGTKYALPKNGIYGFKDLCFGTFSSFRSRCWRWKKAKYYFYADGWCELTFFCKFYITCSCCAGIYFYDFFKFWRTDGSIYSENPPTPLGKRLNVIKAASFRVIRRKRKVVKFYRQLFGDPLARGYRPGTALFCLGKYSQLSLYGPVADPGEGPPYF